VTDKHAAICKGGPWDGKNYAHWSAGPVPIFKPMMEFTPYRRQQDATIQPVEIGRYEWHVDCWWWVPA